VCPFWITNSCLRRLERCCKASPMFTIFSESSQKTGEDLHYSRCTLSTFCNDLRKGNEQRCPCDTSCTDRWLDVVHSLVNAGKQKRFERALRGTTRRNRSPGEIFVRSRPHDVTCLCDDNRFKQSRQISEITARKNKAVPNITAPGYK